MKKLLLVVLMMVMTFTLSACSDLCIGESCVVDEPEVGDTGNGNGESLEDVLYYDHIDGYGIEDENHIAYILFEEEMQSYVKYQVAYLSCTCRASDVNYWQVIYIEVNKYTDDIKLISYGYDDPTSNHPYTAGLWGDSSPTPDWPLEEGGTKPGKTTDDFHEMFIPWLLGKDSVDLEGISVFTNKVSSGVYEGMNSISIDDATYTNPDTNEEIDLLDSFGGASVSTNNMIRISKTILEYHNENYGN